MKRGHGNVYQGPKDGPCRAFNTVKPRPQEPLPAGTRERGNPSLQTASTSLRSLPQTVLPPAEAEWYLLRRSGNPRSGGRPQTSWGTAPDVPGEGVIMHSTPSGSSAWLRPAALDTFQYLSSRKKGNFLDSTSRTVLSLASPSRSLLT